MQEKERKEKGGNNTGRKEGRNEEKKRKENLEGMGRIGRTGQRERYRSKVRDVERERR